MSQTTQETQTSPFREHLEYDGEQYDLVFDPGNPQRAQVIPNYEAMFPQQTSVIQKCELPGVGIRWVAIIDAVTPAQSMQQTGSLPTVERRYLCFRIYQNEHELPRVAVKKEPSGTMEVVPSPLAARPQEMVIYAQSTPGKSQGNRAQRLINALLGAASRDMPAPNPDWTRDFALITQGATGAADVASATEDTNAGETDAAE